LSLLSSTQAARKRGPLSFINLVIPAKAGIQERHIETTLSGFPPSRE